MDDNSENKSLVDYILNGLLVLNIILLLSFGKLMDFRLLHFINLCFIFLNLSIAFPMNDYIKKGVLKSKLQSLILRTGICIVYIIFLYQVFFSRNYHLKYTYIICFALSLLLFYVSILDTSIKEYKRRTLFKKRFNRLYQVASIVISILISVIPIYIIAQSVMVPQNQIELNDIKASERITIYKYASDEDSMDLNSHIEIKTPEDIQMIIDDLKTTQVSSLSYVDILNYEKMKSDNYPYYLLMLEDNFIIKDKNNQTNNSIYYIVITTNQNVVIERSYINDKLFMKNRPNDIYPVNFSKKTLDMIFSYINITE